jgi:transposase-like protein
MSKMKLYKEAERLYLQENLPVNKIAVQLDISRRTIFYWKKKYDWDKRKFEYEHEKDAFNQELLEFARKMMRKLNNDLDKNSHTNQSEIYSFMNILKNIPLLKEYETSISTSKPKQQNFLTPEQVREIEREVLGME